MIVLPIILSWDESPHRTTFHYSKKKSNSVGGLLMKIKSLHYWVIFFMAIIPFISFGQNVKDDSTKMIIDKKFTITFKDEIRLKQVKKTPEYKQVDVEPERNPIIYDKQAFYQSLNIKQTKSLEELFTYPLFAAHLSGGNLNFINGGFSFQANAKKFIPSLSWELEQGKADAKDSNSFLRQKMNFNGGVRLQVTNNLNMDLSLSHRQHKSGDYELSPDSIDVDFQNSYMQIGLKSAYSDEQFSFSLGSVTEDFTHEYEKELHYFQSGLNYQALMNFEKFSIYNNGEMQWAQNEFDNIKNEFSFYYNEFGLKYYNDKFQLKGGFSVLGHDNIIENKNEMNFAPAVDIKFVALPKTFSLFANYNNGFQKTDLNKIQNNYLYTLVKSFLPEIIKYNISGGAEWSPNQNLSLCGWYSQKDFDVLSIWNKNAGDLLYATTMVESDSGKIIQNSINFALEWNYKLIKIIGGASAYSWDLPIDFNTPLLQASNIVYLSAYFKYRKLQVNGEIQYEGRREFLKNETDKENVLLLNLNAHYPVYKKFSVTCGLSNILDQKYSWVPGFREPGLRAAAGIRYKW